MKLQVDKRVENAFVSEARRLASMEKLDGVELDFSARHLCLVLGMKKVRVFLGENILKTDFDQNANELLVYVSDPKSSFKRRELLIAHKPNAGLIEDFVRNMFHFWQLNDLASIQHIVLDGTFQSDAEQFTERVLKQVTGSTGIVLSD